MSGTGNRPKSSGPTPKWYKEAPEEKEEGEVEEDDEEHMEYKHTVLTLGVNTLILQGVDTYQSNASFGRCQHQPKQYLLW